MLVDVYEHVPIIPKLANGFICIRDSSFRMSDGTAEFYSVCRLVRFVVPCQM